MTKRTKDPIEVARARLAEAEKLLEQAEDAVTQAEDALEKTALADVEGFDAAIRARDTAVARRDELKARVAKAEDAVRVAKETTERERRADLDRELVTIHAALASGDDEIVEKVLAFRQTLEDLCGGQRGRLERSVQIEGELGRTPMRDRSHWARAPEGQELKTAALSPEVIKALQRAGKKGW